MKRRVAVLFGGRSPEHDISVITAIQAMDALDTQKYEIIPVYITTSGEWLTGDPLRKRENYLPAPGTPGIMSVRLDVVPRSRPRFLTEGAGFFKKSSEIEFDIALLAFHGLVGEDGGIQGLLETARVPYTGMRVLASALLMDKIATKNMVAGAGVPVLPFREIRRPDQGTHIPPAALKTLLVGLEPPYCVKPSHLGSSIGVGKAEDLAGVAALLPAIFAYDNIAIVEPFVQNMVEYNVAVCRLNGAVATSAIEQPKRAEELLDFRQKYLSGDGKGKNTKVPGQRSEGMLSLTRELNPKLPDEIERNIRAWAEISFDRVYGTGVPRIDFISNEKTGEVWLNEINPCPGSFGFFLWEASSKNHILFSDLLDKLLGEAVALHNGGLLPADPVPEAARILKRNA
ncbi:MAG: D-alanine--D-alanine ligase [Pseudomonadota bacterium]